MQHNKPTTTKGKRELTAEERAHFHWVHSVATIQACEEARAAVPGSERFTYEEYTRFNREWTAAAWAKHWQAHQH